MFSDSSLSKIFPSSGFLPEISEFLQEEGNIADSSQLFKGSELFKGSGLFKGSEPFKESELFKRSELPLI